MTTQPKKKREPLYTALFLVIGRLMAAYFRVRWVHAERVPLSDSAIIVANHVSYLDPFAIGLGLPVSRPIHYMAKSELYKNPLVAWFLHVTHAFPVHRGVADRAAIREALNLLQSSELVGIFPEGTRVRGDKEITPHSGAAFIASMAKAKIVPVGVHGSDQIVPQGKILPRPRKVTIYFGEPIEPEEFMSIPKKERIDVLTARIMECISEARESAREAAERR